MLSLRLQYFGHLMPRADSLEDSDSGEDQGQEEKGATEDEMVGWPHQLNGHESGQTLWEVVKDREFCCAESMGLQRVRNDLVTEQHRVHF